MKQALLRSLFLPIMLVVSTIAWGQGTTTATITGRIANANGEPLEGATVMAIHTPTSSPYGALTNANGYFRIANLQVGGPYEIKATFVGYEDQEEKNVYLILGQTMRLDFSMGEQMVEADEVLITAAREDIFDGNRTGSETYISEEAIQTLPTVNRDFLQDFGRLTPQANLINGGISLMGNNNRFNAIFIDGAVNNDVFGLANSGTNGGQAGISPISPDALEQVQVVLAPYDVKLGGFAGGGINAVTRSGSNEFEGSAYYFFRNERLSGKTPGDLDREERDFLAPFTAQTYGFRLGGPIIRDKLFFFANVEVQRDQEPKPFSFDDYQGLATEQTLQDLDDFLQGQYGYDAGGYQNNVSTRNGEKLLLKLDWNINQNHKLSLRHSYVSGRERDADRPNNQQIVFFNSGVDFPSKTNSSALELKSVFGKRWSNNLILGATIVRDDRDVLGDPFPNVQAQDGNAMVEFGSDPFSYSNIVFQDVFTLTNNLTYSLGNHTLTLGTHNEYFKIQNLFTIFSVPRYFYDNEVDVNGNIIRTGLQQFIDGEPAFSLFGHEAPPVPGDPNSVRFGDEAENLGPTFTALQAAAYLQDEWQVTQNIKLTAGVRVDVPVYLDDAPLINADFNTNVIPQIQAAGYNLKGARAGRLPETSFLISPRIGFNWDIGGNQRTQLRGGAGIFTSRIPWVWPGGMYIRNGLTSSFSAAFGPFAATPEGWRQRLNLNLPSGDVDLYASDFKYPQVARGSLALDKKLGGGFIFTAEGIFTKTLNNIRVQNVNLKPSTQNLEGADTRPIFDQDDLVDDTYNYITLVDNTDEGYSFNITAQLQKPFSNGFMASVAYSYTQAFSLFDGTSFINSTQWRTLHSVNGRNNPMVARSFFDTGSRISAFLSKRFEYGLNYATTISLFFNGQSGQPYNYTYANGDELNNEDSQNQSLIYVPATRDQIVFADEATASEQWAELDEFIRQDPYLSGRRGQYAERNEARTPFEAIVDLKIAQEFFVQIGSKRHTLQATFDIFNFGNFLNANWGKRYFVGNNGNYNLIRFVGFQPNSTQPTFAFDGVDGEPYSLVNSGLQSARWSGLFGIRYLF